MLGRALDNAIAFRAKRGWFGGIGLRTEQDPEKPNPTFIPVANEAAEWLAAHTGAHCRPTRTRRPFAGLGIPEGIAQSMVLEATANIPSTAHILGGAVIGKDAGQRRGRPTQSGLRLPQPAGLRRCGDAGEPGGQPVADDHRHHRTRDEPHPAGAAATATSPGQMNALSPVLLSPHFFAQLLSDRGFRLAESFLRSLLVTQFAT